MLGIVIIVGALLIGANYMLVKSACKQAVWESLEDIKKAIKE